MRTGIVHLSDIHFRKAGNPILDVIDRLVGAVASVDPSVSLFLVVVSGDIAYSGQPAEYDVAIQFFEEFRRKLLDLHPEAAVKYVFIPGNHDCLLPEEQVNLRKILIDGLLPSMQELRQDEALFDQLLMAQAPYSDFRKRLGETSNWDGRCETVFIQHGDRKIQLNLYNTALLSQRQETQGQLYLPIKVLQDRVSVLKDSALCISVFHHSYLWIDSEQAVLFRDHIEKTSDIALSGHQHYSHELYTENSTGERVLYLEAPALQEEKYPKTSAFRVLVIDWDTKQEKVVAFRRSGDLYRRFEETDWRPLTVNRASRAEFRLSDEFEAFLNESGTPFRHKVRGPLKLRDIFLFPSLRVRSAGAKSQPREFSGASVLNYVSTARRTIFQCPGLGGRTSLAKMIFWEVSRGKRGEVPVFLEGYGISTADEAKVLDDIWKAFKRQYSAEMLEEFRQLEPGGRVLVVDNWHRSDLSVDGRKEYLSIASRYFDRIFLFTDELFQIHELLSGSADSMLQFDHATIAEMGHELRGELIDKWVTLGRVQTGNTKEMNREIELKERLIRSMIGRKVLPSRPFFVLALLQADEQERAEVAEAGSFGYLYEVLVTGALSVSKGKAQLEKKYNFLSRLAYQMFKEKAASLPLSRITEIAEQYSHSHLVAVDFPAMLFDLEQAPVLVNVDGNYSFSYPHLFNYFIARYYRDNLGREPSLRAEIEHMIDHVSSDEFAAILMFIVYFVRDSSDVVGRLVDNANRIYPDERPAELDADVAFLNQVCPQPDVEIEEEVDVKLNVKEQRATLDRIEKNAAEVGDRRKQGIVYSEELSDVDKFDIAYQHVTLLGQVIRNFPGSLPGEEKLAILKATYTLGLRVLTAVLKMLGPAFGQLRQSIAAAAADHGTNSEKIRKMTEFLILLVSRMVTLSALSRVSSSVGAADLEEAYKEALELVGKTNASQLIHLMIQLEHFSEFPTNGIRDLQKQFSGNAFASTILSDIVVSRMMVADVDRRTRQSMASLFKVSFPLLAAPEKAKR